MQGEEAGRAHMSEVAPAAIWASTLIPREAYRSGGWCATYVEQAQEDVEGLVVPLKILVHTGDVNDLLPDRVCRRWWTLSASGG